MTDQEYLSRLTNIEIYAEVLLGILRLVPVKNSFPDSVYREELKRKLKFSQISHPDLLRSCIDLIEDTELAINDYRKAGLKRGEMGESYLRLYGVLNACYLQTNAVNDLVKMFNLPGYKSIMGNIRQSKLIVMRNKLGSHTTNFLSEEGIPEFFRLGRQSLSDTGDCLKIVSSTKKVEEFNLKTELEVFNALIEDALFQVASKGIHSLFSSGESKEWLLFRLDFAARRNAFGPIEKH